MKRTPSEIRLYVTTANKIVTDHGGQPTDFEPYNYIIATKAGVLLVDVSDDCCVCTRFKEIDSALTLNLGDRLNIHSGKWNWMGGSDHNGDMYNLALFQQALRKIT
ncbi:hypothetical protein HOV23_gp112 [Pseudomonas phage Lana]|uniref:Uncharacterized protein n=1 Tax=Pseudomonas phage Lana TaxID=2530172 RepID=A0A481W5U6_9CAUD|nr:hypothetical protein HOV23_gp112 [Pseudomonas phage Lana]QBJ04461.1 hypothetical protein [Pseudomonas phage Lana]